MQDKKALFEEAKQRILEDEKKADQVTKELIGYYEKAADDIEMRIEALYSKFAKDNSITPAEANRLLTGKEYTTWRKTMAEYMADVYDEGKDSKTLIEINTLITKGRLTREEKLLADIYRDMAEMAEITNEKFEPALKEILKTSYEHSAYRVQMNLGVCFKVGDLRDRVVDEILNYPWAKKKFSKTIWDDVDNINKHIKSVVTRGMMSGKSVGKMVKELRETTGKGQDVVERAIKTECKFFANKGELEGYKANGIEHYLYIGTTERGFSCDCAFYNNKVISVDKAEPYVNFPPLHPNCRCSVRAYFENSILEKHPNAVKIDDEIPFNEWKHDFLEKNERDMLKKLEKTLKSDIIRVDSVKLKDKNLANKVTIIRRLNGGYDLQFYDSRGWQYKQISNYAHGNIKKHPRGIFGEHAHDYIWIEGKETPLRPERELTVEERQQLEVML